MHTLVVGENLWKPFDGIRLLRVIADDAGLGAVFQRSDNKGGTKDDTIYVEADDGLEFDTTGTGPKTAQNAGQKPTGSGAKVAANNLEWRDPGDQSKESSPGDWSISKKDYDWFGGSYDKAFEDVTLSQYSGRVTDPQTGKALSGLQVTHLGSSLQRYGVGNGDLLISVNGVSVTSKAQLLKTVKDMHQNGTRTFVGRFLVSGRYIERSYTVPNK
jgi:hypothetical protein